MQTRLGEGGPQHEPRGSSADGGRLRGALRLIPAESAEWMEWLACVPHDCYHTAAYHLLAQEFGEGEAFLAVYGERDRFVAWPHLVRRISECAGLEDAAGRDVASVYGYPGPLAHNCGDRPEFPSEAWNALLDWWRSQGIVTVFTRFHPILANHTWVPYADGLPSATSWSGGLIASGHTVSVDLTLTDAENVREYQKVLRQEIGRGRRMGLVTAADEHWSRFDDFIELYHRTMSRNHATRDYFFSPAYFHRLRVALHPHVQLMVTTLGDQVAAACVILEYQGFVQAHLAGSNDDLRSLSPLKVLLDDVRRSAQARGNRVFHLGGGRAGRDDSLLAFKGRFSPRRHDFYVGGWVLDASAYRELCDRRRAHADETGLVLSDEEFFPRYRARLSPRA